MIDFAEDKSVIEQLVAMTSDQFAEAMGVKQQLLNMRKTVMEMKDLTGDARDVAERKVRKMMTPDVSENQLGWALDDALRSAKGKDIADVCC